MKGKHKLFNILLTNLNLKSVTIISLFFALIWPEYTQVWYESTWLVANCEWDSLTWLVALTRRKATSAKQLFSAGVERIYFKTHTALVLVFVYLTNFSKLELQLGFYAFLLLPFCTPCGKVKHVQPELDCKVVNFHLIRKNNLLSAHDDKLGCQSGV